MGLGQFGLDLFHDASVLGGLGGAFALIVLAEGDLVGAAVAVIHRDDFFDMVKLLGNPELVPKAALAEGNLSDTAASEAPASDTWS